LVGEGAKSYDLRKNWAKLHCPKINKNKTAIKKQ
jgi:hypothetical protein